MILCIAGLLVFALAPAHAAVSVEIDLQDGDVLWTLPGLPDGAEYPDELQTVVTGTAGFDVAGGTVLYQFIVPKPDGDIVFYSGEATLSEGCTTECTWSFRVPFLLPPTEYDLKVIASQPNQVDPELDPETADDTVSVMVL